MPKINCYSVTRRRNNRRHGLLLLAGLLLPLTAPAASLGEVMQGYYAREGNDGSPAQTAGNNIYLKFFDDRWLGLLFVPYPYADEVGAAAINQVFTTAKQRTHGASYLKGKFGLLEQMATVQIERYGYLQDSIAFECGAMSACTIRLGEGYLELIKPGVINEHIVRYHHIDAN